MPGGLTPFTNTLWGIRTPSFLHAPPLGREPLHACPLRAWPLRAKPLGTRTPFVQNIWKANLSFHTQPLGTPKSWPASEAQRPVPLRATSGDEAFHARHLGTHTPRCRTSGNLPGPTPSHTPTGRGAAPFGRLTPGPQVLPNRTASGVDGPGAHQAPSPGIRAPRREGPEPLPSGRGRGRARQGPAPLSAAAHLLRLRRPAPPPRLRRSPLGGRGAPRAPALRLPLPPARPEVAAGHAHFPRRAGETRLGPAHPDARFGAGPAPGSTLPVRPRLALAPPTLRPRPVRSRRRPPTAQANQA